MKTMNVPDGECTKVPHAAFITRPAARPCPDPMPRLSVLGQALDLFVQLPTTSYLLFQRECPCLHPIFYEVNNEMHNDFLIWGPSGEGSRGVLSVYGVAGCRPTVACACMHSFLDKTQQGRPLSPPYS